MSETPAENVAQFVTAEEAALAELAKSLGVDLATLKANLPSAPVPVADTTPAAEHVAPAEPAPGTVPAQPAIVGAVENGTHTIEDVHALVASVHADIASIKELITHISPIVKQVEDEIANKGIGGVLAGALSGSLFK